MRTLATLVALIVAFGFAFAGEPSAQQLPATSGHQLEGVWISPPLLLDEDMPGFAEMSFVFLEKNKPGLVTLTFLPDEDTLPDQTVGPLQADVKGPEIILSEKGREGRQFPVTALSYELKGDQLKLTFPRGFDHPALPGPIEMTGDWHRAPGIK